MNKFVAVAALSVAALCGSAQAAITTYDFSASVAYLIRPVGSPVQDPVEGALPGSVVAVGDHIAGTMTIDTGTTALVNDGANGQFWQLNSPTSFQYTLLSTGQTFSSANTFGLSVYNDHAIPGSSTTYDLFNLSVHDVGGLHSIVLTDDSSLAFSSSQIPQHLALGQFTDASLITGYLRASDHATVRMLATITSFNAVSAVPEPATYLMLLAGLAVVGASARRAKTAT